MHCVCIFLLNLSVIYDAYIYANSFDNFSQNHKIIGLGRDLGRSSPAPPPLVPKQVPCSKLHRKASRWVLSISIEADSTTSLSSLCQCSVQRGRTTSLGLLASVFLMQPRIPLAFLLPGHTAGSWPTCSPPGYPGPPLQSSCPPGQPLTCTYLSQDVGLCTHMVSLCLTLQFVQVLPNGRCIPFVYGNFVVEYCTNNVWQLHEAERSQQQRFRYNM